MDQSKARRMIVGGFLFIVVMSVSVFFAMNQYMGVRTSSDVRQVAQSYVTGIAAEALYPYLERITLNMLGDNPDKVLFQKGKFKITMRLAAAMRT